MRKRFLSRTLLVFALVLSILVCAIPADAVQAAKLTNKKVQKVLKKNIKNVFCKYAFSDIDKDGLDELITIQYDWPFGFEEDERSYYEIVVLIYKYSDGESKVIFSWEDLMIDNFDISLDLYYKDTGYLKLAQEYGEYGNYQYYKLSDGKFKDLCSMCFDNYYDYNYYFSEMKPTTEEKFNKKLRKFPKDDSKLDIDLKLSSKKLANSFIKEYLNMYVPHLSEDKELVTSEIKDFDGDGYADMLVKDASGESVIYSADIDSCSLRLKSFTDNVTDDSEEVKEYVRKNYPGLMKLFDEGAIRFSAEYERDTVRLGSWDMEYWEKTGEGEDAKEVLVTDGIKEDIEWDILGYSEDGQYAYAISRYILFDKQFNEKRSKVYYKKSTLCKYLNGEFYENAFSESEKELIGDSLSGDEKFKVTVLNTVELRQFYDYDLETTAKERIGTYIDGRVGMWWTATSGLPYGDEYEGYSLSNASLKRRVLYDGSIESTDNAHNEDSQVGVSVKSSCGVRPFITIRLTPEFIEANNLSVGNVKPNLKKVFVVFGTHDISETASVPMEWEILDYDKKSGKILLASRYIEKSIAYDDDNEKEKTSWEECSLRKWLNSEFYEEAFNKKEKALITANTYSKEKDIEDYVFILSYSEVEKYYPITDARSIVERTCALRNGGSRAWWLRTPDEASGITSSKVALIEMMGYCNIVDAGYAFLGVCEDSLIMHDYDYSIYDNTVRPAIYITK